MNHAKKILILVSFVFIVHCGPSQSKSINWISSPSLNELMAPKNLSVLCDGSQYLVLTWDMGDSTATGFFIERKTADEEFSVIEEVEADPMVENFHDNIKPNIEYTYRMQGILKNADGSIDYVSQYSSEVSGTADDRCGTIIVDSQGNPSS